MSDEEERKKIHNPVQDEEILLLSLWNTFSSSHLGKPFTPLDALHYFHCENGSNKSEEIREQEKEEMVLFSIKIRWKRILCLSFRVTDEKISLCFPKSFHEVFVSFISILLSEGKEQKRNEKFLVFPLWIGLLLFLFNLVLKAIHMCIITIFLLI